MDTSEKRIKTFRGLIHPSWDSVTDPDKVFSELRDKQSLLNNMAVDGVKAYDIPDQMVMDIIVGCLYEMEGIYGSLIPVIIHDKDITLDEMKDLIRAQYARATESPSTMGLFAGRGKGKGKKPWEKGDFKGECFYCEEKAQHRWQDCPKYQADLKKPCGKCGMTGKCVEKWCKKPKKTDEEGIRKINA